MDERLPEARIRLGHGPRDVEAGLLEEVFSDTQRARESPERLSRPIRIVVPSRSLRLHLGARLVAHNGRALAGVTIQTLHGLASEILERVGASPLPSDVLFPVLVRQAAARHPLVRAELDALVDGYGPVQSGVEALLDAGFDSVSREPLRDALQEHAAGASVARARALVEVTAEVFARLDGEKVGHRSQWVEAAGRALEQDPERALPARTVFIHGFAEVTGLRGDLLRALVLHRRARVWLDAPRDPADAGRSDPGVAFLRRLRERLEGVAPVEEREDAVPRAEVTAFRAPGAAAEAREVAERVLVLHEEEGVPFESIGVVARDLGAHRSALRRQLQRLGVPFSGVDGHDS